MIRSHQNNTSNLSPALIQPHVLRRPLTSIQLDVQRKIELILGESHFRASDSNVVTFTFPNYASKLSLSLILGNVVVSAMIMKFDQARKCQKHEQITKSVSNMWLFHMSGALLTNLRFMLRSMPRYVPRVTVTITVFIRVQRALVYNAHP